MSQQKTEKMKSKGLSSSRTRFRSTRSPYLLTLSIALRRRTLLTLQVAISTLLPSCKQWNKSTKMKLIGRATRIQQAPSQGWCLYFKERLSLNHIAKPKLIRKLVRTSSIYTRANCGHLRKKYALLVLSIFILTNVDLIRSGSDQGQTSKWCSCFGKGFRFTENEHISWS